MAGKSLPLSKVYSLLESGPVGMVATARTGRRITIKSGMKQFKSA